MKPSDKFTLVEGKTQYLTMVPLAEPFHVLHWKIIRVSDGVEIRRFDDYLEALKYLEALEDRSWLVS